MNGESRPGPRSSRILCCSVVVCSPPMPEPMIHADFVAVHLVQIEPGILERLPCGIDAELRETVGAPDLLGRRERGAGIEILHLAGDLCVERRRVEGGDSVDAALAGNQASRKRRRRCPSGVTTPRPVIDHSALHPVAGHKLKGAAQAQCQPKLPRSLQSDYFC